MPQQTFCWLAPLSSSYPRRFQYLVNQPAVNAVAEVAHLGCSVFINLHNIERDLWRPIVGDGWSWPVSIDTFLARLCASTTNRHRNCLPFLPWGAVELWLNLSPFQLLVFFKVYFLCLLGYTPLLSAMVAFPPPSVSFTTEYGRHNLDSFSGVKQADHSILWWNPSRDWEHVPIPNLLHKRFQQPFLLPPPRASVSSFTGMASSLCSIVWESL